MSNLPWSEDEALRHSYPMYDEWERGDEPEQDRDIYAEADEMFERMRDEECLEGV